MRKLLAAATLTLCAITCAVSHAEVFELRTYHANDGKIDALHDRFRNHTLKLFEKHGMRNVGYWRPADQPDTIIYIVAHADQEAAKANWGSFVSDPEWQAVYKASIADGRLVREIISVYMAKTDYSP